MYRLLFYPLVPLTAFAAALSSMYSLYIAEGNAPSANFQMIASFCWGLLLAIWVVTDARQRGYEPCFDFGFFCYVFLPVMLPGYCLWSRGWRGFFTLLVIALLWILPNLVAGLVWLSLYG